jgi:hypothetical protein
MPVSQQPQQNGLGANTPPTAVRASTVDAELMMINLSDYCHMWPSIKASTSHAGGTQNKQLLATKVHKPGAIISPTGCKGSAHTQCTLSYPCTPATAQTPHKSYGMDPVCLQVPNPCFLACLMHPLQQHAHSSAFPNPLDCLLALSRQLCFAQSPMQSLCQHTRCSDGMHVSP